MQITDDFGSIVTRKVIQVKRVLYIRRKGFNYYTDYTELYLHKALQNYGFSLIKEKEKSAFGVTIYISESEKYMAILSPFFDSIDEADLVTLCENFSSSFKSEAIVSACPDDAVFPGDKEYFMFSENYSAFDEPVYLTESPASLHRKIADCFFRSNNPYLIRFVNTGGKLSGINIALDFEEDIRGLSIEKAEIIYYINKEETRKPVNFTKSNNSFFADADFLFIDKGINPACAVLRAKKLYTEEEKHGFSLILAPKSNDDIILKPTLKILNGDSEIFKERLFFPPPDFKAGT